MPSRALSGIFPSGRRPQGFSSTLFKVPITFMWTFHTNSPLHEYLLLMHVHKYNYINTFINELVFSTVIIQC